MPNYKRKILNKFKGYDVSVDFYPADGDCCDTYYLRISSDEIDNYVWNVLDEIWNEYGLSAENHYEEGGYDCWELFYLSRRHQYNIDSEIILHKHCHIYWQQ